MSKISNNQILDLTKIVLSPEDHRFEKMVVWLTLEGISNTLFFRYPYEEPRILNEEKSKDPLRFNLQYEDIPRNLFDAYLQEIIPFHAQRGYLISLLLRPSEKDRPEFWVIQEKEDYQLLILPRDLFTNYNKIKDYCETNKLEMNKILRL